MQEKSTTKVLFMRAAIILVALICILLCAYWIPFKLLTANGQEKDIFYVIRLIFYSVAVLPVLAIMIICWKISCNVKCGTVFSLKTSKHFLNISKITAIDSAAFLVGQIVMSLLKWNMFDILFFIVGVFGLIAAMIAYLVSDYVEMASKIKEENDSIL